jgi:hypothetical protein
VALVVLTGGTAAPLLAIAAAGALIGAGAAILIARATSSDLSFGDYIAVALTGAVIGASVAVGVAVIAGAPAAATLPAWFNAQGALGAAFGSISSTVLGVTNGVSPWALFGTVLLGTLIGYASGEATGLGKDISIDTADLTPSLKAVGLDLSKSVLAAYSGGVNGYFTTAGVTGEETHLPSWLGTVFTLSGIFVPAGASLYGVWATPGAATAAANAAPAVP